MLTPKVAGAETAGNKKELLIKTTPKLYVLFWGDNLTGRNTF